MHMITKLLTYLNKPLPTQFWYDSGDGDEWDGRKGLVHEAVLEDIKSLSSYEVYACGSPKMIEVARSDFVSNGLMSDKFYSDAFVASR